MARATSSLVGTFTGATEETAPFLAFLEPAFAAAASAVAAGLAAGLELAFELDFLEGTEVAEGFADLGLRVAEEFKGLFWVVCELGFTEDFGVALGGDCLPSFFESEAVFSGVFFAGEMLFSALAEIFSD